MDSARRSLHWTSDMEIGVPEIDEQHKSLFGMANVLLHLFGTKDRQLVEQSFDQLILYTMEHFEAEERVLAEMGDRGLAHHAKEHDFICAQLKELQEMRDSMTPEELFEFLADWLVHHVMAEVVYLRRTVQRFSEAS